ncbi:Os05g0471232 [Oryza sativa Japonica Group]|uniref:Os05g0471232 protein n=1 Tax=Oryza sativa subsp. japonica TaxID=39947 RepID=A0A0P0WNL8_ORYSJ|nr:Os05g0471232 [Oryza sativa Japonica Group]
MGRRASDMERGTGVRLGMGRRAPDVELGGGCWTWSRRRVLDMDGDFGGGGGGGLDMERGASVELGTRWSAPDMERDEEIVGECARGATTEKPLAPQRGCGALSLPHAPSISPKNS